jgi:hypothetical protein
MGQIASDGVNNLSYLNRRASITTPMEQNPVDKAEYNSSKTYMMFVMGMFEALCATPHYMTHHFEFHFTTIQFFIRMILNPL